MNDKKIKIPRIIPFPKHVKLGRWLKESGDYVEAGTEICTLKAANYEWTIYSSHVGILEHLVKEGSSLNPIQTLALLKGMHSDNNLSLIHI